MTYVSATGKHLASMNAAFGVVDAADVEIVRGDLVGILHEAARSGTEYIFGDSVTGMAEVPGAVEVTFERAEPRTFGDKNGSVVLTIDLPAGSSLVAYLAHSSVHADGSFGECELHMASGRVQLDRINALQANIAAGEVAIGHIAGRANIDGSAVEMRISEIQDTVTQRIAAAVARSISTARPARQPRRRPPPDPWEGLPPPRARRLPMRPTRPGPRRSRPGARRTSRAWPGPARPPGSGPIDRPCVREPPLWTG